MLQVLVGPDVYNLIERTEVGVPEGPLFGVFFPEALPLGKAFFEFTHCAGSQGIGTDFV